MFQCVSCNLLCHKLTETYISAILQISCGSFHSLLLTADGGVYSWGSNVHGQLGHPQVPEMVLNYNIMYTHNIIMHISGMYNINGLVFFSKTHQKWVSLTTEK